MKAENLGAKWDGMLTSLPGRLNPGKDPVPFVTEGWAGPKAGLEGNRKSSSNGGSSSGLSNP
jgi:hypothetical protein